MTKFSMPETIFVTGTEAGPSGLTVGPASLPASFQTGYTPGPVNGHFWRNILRRTVRQVGLLALDALDQFRRIVVVTQFGVLIQHALGGQPRSLIVFHTQHRVSLVHFFLC